MSQAQVTSLETLRHLRAALIKFGESGREAMVGLDMELRRGLQWLLEEQPQFWKHEQRRLHDCVLEARQELHRCMSRAMPGERAPCSEQKHALERVIAQLRHAEEMTKVTRQWGQRVEHEAHEWQGRANQFTHLLEATIPAAIALLDRAIAALEGYLGITYVSGAASAGRSTPTVSPTEAASPATANLQDTEDTDAAH